MIFCYTQLSMPNSVIIREASSCKAGEQMYRTSDIMQSPWKTALYMEGLHQIPPSGVRKPNRIVVRKSVRGEGRYQEIKGL